jgi:hypothetical protein
MVALAVIANVLEDAKTEKKKVQHDANGETGTLVDSE